MTGCGSKASTTPSSRRRSPAYAITGRQQEHAGVPWFWSNQGELRLQIAGLSAGHDRTLVRRNDAQFCVLYYRGDQILAADCMNAPLDFMAVKAVKAALAGGVCLPYDRAKDPATPLKSITAQASAPGQTRNEQP